jgi:hypothetical protein
MTRSRRPVLALGALAVSGLLLAGCTVSGSGFTFSTNGAKRATFGFTVTDEPGGDSVIRGSWADGSVKFRFVSGSFDFDTNPDSCSPISGTYTSTVKSSLGQTGGFDLEVCDFGEPGVNSGDTIDLDLTSGPFSGYSNDNTIQGGNLKINANNDGP